MRCRILILLIVVACKGKSSKPLPEAILGEWDVLCRTDAESKTSCLGKEPDQLYNTFRPGGEIELGSRKNTTTMSGRWALTNDDLVVTFQGGGNTLEERYRARIEHDQLILWNVRGGFGTVLGRAGAAFEPAASPTTSGAPVTGEIGGVRYKIALPAGYRLGRDDNQRQVWEPTSGDGFTVHLTVSPRSQTEVNGKWITPPCNDYDYGGVSGSSQTINGVERETSIGISICLKDRNDVLSCDTEHTRGYLEASEKPAALALCKSLEIAG